MASAMPTASAERDRLAFHTWIGNSIPQPADFRLESLLSPLSDDSSTIWVVVSTRSATASLIHKYHVSHPRAQALSIAHISSWGLPDSVQYGALEVFSITFAGYADLLLAGKIMSLRGGSKTLSHPEAECSHLSAYSGAMTYSTWEKVVIQYYE
ncbi:hypothetical protein FPV67DRAFT_1677699 [Lyophyllum atratum]|nr:hypothetical protein FPV67DRAFT_1677699 [Lyophyllum atratum]